MIGVRSDVDVFFFLFDGVLVHRWTPLSRCRRIDILIEALFEQITSLFMRARVTSNDRLPLFTVR